MSPPEGSYSGSKFQLWGAVSPPPVGASTRGWSRWIGALELYYNPEFCEVCPRQSGVIAGQSLNFGGLYLRPPGGYRVVGGLFGEGPSSCTTVPSFEPLGLGVNFRASLKSSTPLIVSGHAQERAPCRPRLLVRPRSGGPPDRRFRSQNSFFMGIGRKWFFAYNSGTRRSPEPRLEIPVGPLGPVRTSPATTSGAVRFRSYGGANSKLREPVARPADGLSTWAWWRWIGDLELYYNPEFCEVCPRQRGVIAGQSFNFGGLYLRPPGGHRLWAGGVG